MGTMGPLYATIFRGTLNAPDFSPLDVVGIYRENQEAGEPWCGFHNVPEPMVDFRVEWEVRFGPALALGCRR
jgi:hypothetical protein